MIYRFANFALDTELLELRSAQGPVRVEPQVFSLLVYLIENRSHVVSKEDLIEAVWEGRIVSDDTLNSRVSAARRAVGDTGAAQAVIRTFPRRGFRFVAEIDVPASPPPGRGPSDNDLPARIDDIDQAIRPWPYPSRLAIALIIVLPFGAPAGIDSADQKMADAITEDLNNALCRFKEVGVISHRTAQLLRGKPVDVAVVGRELGVHFAIEGGVRTQGDLLRVNIRLVEVTSRRQMWADLYERDKGQRFAVQDEIVRGLARALQLTLVEIRSRRPNARPSEAGIDAAAKGTAALNRGLTLQNLTEARAYYDEALRRDPNLLPVMTGAAAVSLALVRNLLTAEPETHLQQAERILQQALEKDPSNGRGHHFWGELQKLRGRHAAAWQSFTRALELNPSLPYTYGQMGHSLLRAGRPSEAMPYLRYAIRLGPKDPGAGFWCLHAAHAEYELVHHEAALDWAVRAVAMLPDGSPNAHASLAVVYALLGDAPNAEKNAAHVRELVSEGWIERWLKHLERDARDSQLELRRLKGALLAFARSAVAVSAARLVESSPCGVDNAMTLGDDQPIQLERKR